MADHKFLDPDGVEYALEKMHGLHLTKDVTMRYGYLYDGLIYSVSTGRTCVITFENIKPRPLDWGVIILPDGDKTPFFTDWTDTKFSIDDAPLPVTSLGYTQQYAACVALYSFDTDALPLWACVDLDGKVLLKGGTYDAKYYGQMTVVV